MAQKSMAISYHLKLFENVNCANYILHVLCFYREYFFLEIIYLGEVMHAMLQK